MTDDLKLLLQQLPEPEPPSSISATVMARIAREVEQRAEAQTSPAVVTRERPVWILAVAGAAIAFLVLVNGWLSTGSMPDMTSARIGIGRPAVIPILDLRLTALLAVAFLVYLAGLFAPLRRGEGR